MSPSLPRIRSEDKLPAAADAGVICGRIAGGSPAYFLAKLRPRVALLEKGYIGGEQSSRNWGWCRQQNRDVRDLPLATRALSLWEDMTRDIGRDLGFRRCGLYYATDKPQQLATWEAWGQNIGRPGGVRT